MVAGLVDLAARRGWALLTAHLLVLAAVLAVAIAGAGSLPIGSTGPSGSTAGEPDLIVATTGRDPVRSGIYRVTLGAISSQIRADAAVAEVREGPISDDRRSTSLLVSLGGLDGSSKQDAVERIEGGIDPGPLKVSYGGEVGNLLDARHELATDFWKLELAAMPFVALVLALALGARLAAAAIICAATAIAGALAALVLLGLVADVSLLGSAPAAVVGLVLGIEAPCALFARFRAEASRAPRPEALRRAVRTTVDLAIPAALAAALVTVGIVATSLDQAPSMIIGCAVAAALALGSALVCGPAIVALAADDRHLSGQAPVAGWLARRCADPAGRLASSRRATALAAGVGTVLLLGAAFPLIHAQGQPFTSLDLPTDSPARMAAELAGVTADLGGGDAVFGDLALAAGVAAVVLVVVLGIAFRSRLALPVGIASLLPAAAACGLCVLVFQEGHLADAIGLSGQGALESGAAGSLVVALASVSAARSASAMQAGQEATGGGLDPAWAAQWTSSLLVPGMIVATLIGAAATGVLAGATLYPAREFGLAVAVGLVLDLVLLRLPLIAVIARRGRG
ncbi:MAG: MMPL family transporter [Solirubrobacterales bacterium]